MFNLPEYRAAMARKGLTKKDVAQALNITEVTLWRKLKRGGDFSRAEINTLVDLMDIEDVAAVFFAPEVTNT